MVKGTDFSAYSSLRVILSLKNVLCSSTLKSEKMPPCDGELGLQHFNKKPALQSGNVDLERHDAFLKLLVCISVLVHL